MNPRLTLHLVQQSKKNEQDLSPTDLNNLNGSATSCGSSETHGWTASEKNTPTSKFFANIHCWKVGRSMSPRSAEITCAILRSLRALSAPAASSWESPCRTPTRPEEHGSSYNSYAKRCPKSGFEIHMADLNHDTLWGWTITMDHGLLTRWKPWYPLFHPKIAGKMDVQEKMSIAIKSQGKIPMIVNHSVLKRYNIQSIQYGCHRDYSYIMQKKC